MLPLRPKAVDGLLYIVELGFEGEGLRKSAFDSG